MSLSSGSVEGYRAPRDAPIRTGLLARLNAVLAWRVRVRHVTSRLERPLASFTFDDFPRSAWTVGGLILRRYNAAATYYVAGRFCGVTEGGVIYYDAEDLKAVHEEGHEVGCHTYTHRHSSLLTPSELRADWDRNCAFVRQVLGDVKVSSFAYPFGAVSPLSKVLASRRFRCSRGIRPGVNAGAVDIDQLRVVRLESSLWSAQSVEQSVEEAKKSNGWIVFVSHDLSETPTSYGIHPGGLDHALATVRGAGIDILPVRDALARLLAS